MPPYETRILDPSEFDDTELGSEVRAAWAEGVRVIELVEPRTLHARGEDMQRKAKGLPWPSHLPPPIAPII